jgi:hypothetical protein
MDKEQNKEPFKVCSLCGHVWPSRGDFLSDPDIVLDGYQADFDVLLEGFFIFIHDLPACRTALAVDVGPLRDLYEGQVFPERKTDTVDCPRFCFDPQEVSSCPNACECAHVRELLQIIREWPKEKRL